MRLAREMNREGDSKDSVKWRVLTWAMSDLLQKLGGGLTQLTADEKRVWQLQRWPRRSTSTALDRFPQLFTSFLKRDRPFQYLVGIW